MLLPDIVHLEELNSIGITEKEIIDSAYIVNSFLGRDFLRKEEGSFLVYEKDGFIKHLNLNPVHSWLRNSTIESKIWLVNFAGILLTLKDQKALSGYKSRIQEKDLAMPAIFELIVSAEFASKGYDVEIEKLKTTGNPVEAFVFCSKTNTEFWVECKTEKDPLVLEDLSDKIHRKTTLEIKKKPLYCGIKVELKDKLATIDDVKKIMNKVKQVIVNETPLYEDDEIKIQFIRFTKGGLLLRKKVPIFMEETDINFQDTTLLLLLTEATTSTGGVSGINPESFHSSDNGTYIIAVKHPDISKEPEEKDLAKIKKILNKKIKQHDDLLKERKNVLIVINSDLIEDYEVQLRKFLEEKSVKYPFLSIAKAKIFPDLKTGKLQCDMQYLICSNELKNIPI